MYQKDYVASEAAKAISLWSLFFVPKKLRIFQILYDVQKEDIYEQIR